MKSKFFFRNPPVKLKIFKNDLAPLGFYFDLFSTEIFEIPIMPIPMRIDKLTNGELTFFIIPDFNKLDHLFEELDLVINFKTFFLIGVKNLINYAKKKYKEITLRTLRKESIINWFEKSKMISVDILSLTEDYTFLISEFLKLYSRIVNKGIESNEEKYFEELINYCEKVTFYFQERIEKNIFQVRYNGIIKDLQLYKEKDKKYYPEIVSIYVDKISRNKKKKMNFVPYLIYDDIFDSFSYNIKILHESPQSAIDLTVWNIHEIINKRSSINQIYKEPINNFKLKNIELEEAL